MTYQMRKTINLLNFAKLEAILVNAFSDKLTVILKNCLFFISLSIEVLFVPVLFTAIISILKPNFQIDSMRFFLKFLS